MSNFFLLVRCWYDRLLAQVHLFAQDLKWNLGNVSGTISMFGSFWSQGKSFALFVGFSLFHVLIWSWILCYYGSTRVNSFDMYAWKTHFWIILELHLFLQKGRGHDFYFWLMTHRHQAEVHLWPMWRLFFCWVGNWLFWGWEWTMILDRRWRGTKFWWARIFVSWGRTRNVWRWICWYETWRFILGTI